MKVSIKIECKKCANGFEVEAAGEKAITQANDMKAVWLAEHKKACGSPVHEKTKLADKEV